ncbi:MAG: hypothetical protein J5494_08130 [Candidatus Methanomethylophilaceae archaeon]|nr:hypothetical protein [Candidatus Methanomethylophilaceae archaeon]
MFTAACRRAARFTCPLLRQNSSGTPVSAGTFIVINSKGWVLTAKHLFPEDSAGSAVFG